MVGFLLLISDDCYSLRSSGSFLKVTRSSSRCHHMLFSRGRLEDCWGFLFGIIWSGLSLVICSDSVHLCFGQSSFSDCFIFVLFPDRAGKSWQENRGGEKGEYMQQRAAGWTRTQDGLSPPWGSSQWAKPAPEFRIYLISVPSFHGVWFLAWLDEEKQGRMVPAGAPVGESDIRTCAILSPHM